MPWAIPFVLLVPVVGTVSSAVACGLTHVPLAIAMVVVMVRLVQDLKGRCSDGHQQPVDCALVFEDSTLGRSKRRKGKALI
jgi:hypothetical protein